MRLVNFSLLLKNIKLSPFRTLSALIVACAVLAAFFITRPPSSTAGVSRVSGVSPQHTSLSGSDASPSVTSPVSIPALPAEHAEQAGSTAKEAHTVAEKGSAPSNGQLSQLITQARHRVMLIDETASRLDINRGATHFIQNPGQSLTARFGEGTARLASTKGESWQVALRYSGASAHSTIQADASRVSIQHPDGVVEWYDNSENGIEHGFTLASRATDTGSREISIALEGMQAQQNGEDILWTLPDGGNALSYSGLLVKDASGTALPAQMAATSSGLTIHIQDQNAVYPVHVDPVITRATAKLGSINRGDGNSGDYFGNAIATDGQTLAVAAVNDNDDEGSVYIFNRTDGEWIFKTKLYPTGTSSHKKFGTSLALQGSTLVVGAPGDTFYGSGYIYEKVADVWTLSAKVTQPEGVYFNGKAIGSAVAVDDGVVMVGADGYTGGSPAVIGKGYVFVYGKVSGVWTQQARLEDPSGTTNDEYGSSLVIKSGYAYIGKPGKNAGEVMIYKKSGISWTYVTRLYGVSAGDRFGDSLATDGSALAIGAPYDATAAGAAAGSVQVFRKSADTWASEGILTATDGVSYDYFGTSVAIEGSRLLIGSVRGFDSRGCAYIFEKTTTWTQKTRLVPYNTSIDGRAGYSVAMVGDAVWVGAYHSDTYANMSGGIVNEYRLISAAWEYTDYITSGDSGFLLSFGSVLDMDGQRIVVGVPRDSSPYGEFVGSVYVFVKADAEWQLEAFLESDQPVDSGNFGAAVELEGDTLMVGTPEDAGDTSAFGRYGSVTCFRRGTGGWVRESKIRPTIISGSSSDKFGAAISMKGDSLLIGAPQYCIATPGPGGTSYNTPGAGFLFKKIGATWVQQARLIVAGSTSYWKVGAKVALGDGRLFLTAPQSLGPSSHYGRVVEFTGSGTTWVQATTIMPDAWGSSETFGSTISLDGDALLVGSSSDSRARIYRRSGSTWQQEAVLSSPEPADGKSHFFGTHVALKGDLALVSDTSDFVIGKLGGSIHVFRKQSGTWTRTEKLFAPDASDYAEFGTTIVTDGTSVLTGAINETIRNSLTGDLTDYHGSVYLFELGEGTKGLEVIRQDQFTTVLTSLSRSGSALSFPWTIVGSSALPEKVILRNTGSAAVSGFSITLQGADATQFNYQHPFFTSLPTSIAPGSEVVIYLYFSPTLTGVNKSASLLITNDDGAGDYQIGLSGLANAVPQKTGGTFTCFAGQPFTIFAKDLAMDPDGHTFVLNNSNVTALQNGSLIASGNKLTFTANAGFTGNIIFWYYVTDQYGAYSQIVNTMKVVAPPAGSGGAGSSAFSTQPIQRLDASTLGVLLKGESGVSYQIQRSIDLQTWETLGSAAPVSSGDLLFMDYQNSMPNAFYRLLK